MNQNFTALLKQAQIHHQKKEHVKAIEYLKKTLKLKPDYYDGWIILGITYHIIKDYDMAIESFMKAIQLNPDSHEAHKNLGKTLFEAKKEIDAAIFCFKKAISLKQDDLVSLSYLADIYIHNSNYKEALEIFNIIIKLKPDNFTAYYHMGKILVNCGELSKAKQCYEKVLELNPSHKDTHHGMGILLSMINDFEGGMTAYKKALELGCNEVEVYGDIAATLLYNNMVDEAREYYEKIMEKDPENPRILCAYGQTFMIKGDFEKGLKYYEYRLLKQDYSNKKEIYKKIKQPHWNGEELNGKTIYVYFEQGFGDTTQFSRFIPQLISMGAKVIFKPQPSFYRLFLENNLGAEIIHSVIPDDKIKFDTHISLMSLPYYLKTNINNIPLSEGYIKANPELVKQYKEKYFHDNCFKIGIAWQGGKLGFTNRNIPLENFFPLAKIPNVKLYSFQKDKEEDNLKKLPDNIDIIDLGQTFNDFYDTAAALENLDLIIISDTSVAHLAGALSKPVWLMLPFGSEWRWLLDRGDSPWYKSFKLYRQCELNKWDYVFNNVLNELQKTLSLS